ncbi:MAG: LysR family transcriptional regulator [Burkholderiaceae bacterium]
MTTEDGEIALPEEWRLRKQIRIRHLLLLQALDRHGSLSMAARDLSVTQPAATKLLAQLEALLQLPLFDRRSRGMEPTEYGQIMIRHAHAAMGEIGAAHDALEQTAQGAQGRVSIGAVVGSVPRLTSIALADVLQTYPRLAVSVTVETSATLVPMLERGELDFVIGQIPANAQVDDLSFEPLVGEPLEIVAAVGHRAAQSRQVRLDSLLTDLWVMPPQASPLRARLDAVFHSAGLAVPRRSLETASTLMATTLVQAMDSSVAVLSRDVAQHYATYATLSVLKVSLPTDLGMIGIITRPRLRLTAAALAMIEVLRGVVRPR